MCTLIQLHKCYAPEIVNEYVCMYIYCFAFKLQDPIVTVRYPWETQLPLMTLRTASFHTAHPENCWKIPSGMLYSYK